jgi:putative endonuclease
MGNKDEPSTRDIGQAGESVATEFLSKKGFKIIERNYRRPWGEIDIIAEKDGIVRFVEVKSVSRESHPDISREISEYRPEEQVHPAKLRKIARTAELYMVNIPDKEYQIDVVGVFLDMRTRTARCRLYEQVL